MTAGLELVAFSILIAWLYVHANSLLFQRKVTRTTCKPPVHFSWVPFLGPIINIARKGSNPYISSLCASQESPIATLRLPGQDMHLIHPLDTASLKQFTSMRHLSLMAVFHIVVGPAMALTAASNAFLTQPDSGAFKKDLSKLFNNELRSMDNLRAHASQLQIEIDRHWDARGDAPFQVGLGGWVFDMLSYSMGTVFWGAKGPFSEDDFRQDLRLFFQNLEPLRTPVGWLIPSKLRSARQNVRRRIGRAVRDDAYGTPESPTLFSRLAQLYGTLDISPEGFTDCHLVALVGLLSNVINILSWALCHILADSDLLSRVTAELRNVATDDVASGALWVDADKIRNECPLLVATWYELLRTYADAPVARTVAEDSLFADRFEVSKGSILMTPIHLHNFDREIWGEDADDFKPDRFLRKDGRKADAELVKHLNVFGLPGMHQCPGRYLGLTLTLSLLAKALLGFDITAIAQEGRLEVPPRKETMLGLPALGRDPEVVLKRRQAVQVDFSHVQPGW